jgi:hypothetical protein
MSLQFRNGHLLYVGGHLAHSPACCCNPCEVIQGGVPDTITVELQGFAAVTSDEVCCEDPECDQINGSYTLDLIGEVYSEDRCYAEYELTIEPLTGPLCPESEEDTRIGLGAYLTIIYVTKQRSYYDYPARTRGIWLDVVIASGADDAEGNWVPNSEGLWGGVASSVSLHVDSIEYDVDPYTAEDINGISGDMIFGQGGGSCEGPCDLDNIEVSFTIEEEEPPP